MVAIDYVEGDLVWFDPGVGYVIPGEVKEYHRAAQVVSIQAVIAGKPQVFSITNLSNVRRRQDLGQYGVDDMIQLADLNEASLLWNLRIRYDKELIYTYTGSILVAVNPYKMFDIYGLDMVKRYEGKILGTLPPHLFAIGSSAYGKMSKDSENQVVVISGESGAGKTESTKLIMQYLAAVNKSPSNLITEQILEASPLLESFGNAKTAKNDNSSRFGKFVELFFTNDGAINGARTTDYLLEKSRIVTHSQEERNYHVFYEFLKGMRDEEKEKYGLQTSDKYFYLNQGGSCEIDGKDDGEDFQSLLAAMQVLGFSMEEQDTIFRILASVLHFGNVYFHRRQLRHGQEGVEMGSDAQVKWVAHLLQLPLDGIEQALTFKMTEARGERLYSPLNIEQALDARDAMAKALYHTLFSWLVQRINQIVFKGSKRTSISILDIFGFEDFKENSFEQLCINYANENLQYYFSKHVFKLEQQEYAKEKIEWSPISFPDNQPIIQLIAKKPVGLFHLLDDESNFPKATDVSFMEKCHYNHALNELYSRPRLSGLEFGVKHYAGHVWYNVEGFLDKNRDILRPEVLDLLVSSKIHMVSKMFKDVRKNIESSKTLSKADGRFVTMKPRTPTVAARFHSSLVSLMETMSKCNPWFVRCLKPNNDKAPMKFDMPIVLEQLRYTGMLETIRIRQLGYPVRMRFGQFADRYRCLLQQRPPRGTAFKEICAVILDAHTEGPRDRYQIGLNKVFLREELERSLEGKRASILEKAAVVIQKFVKGKMTRKKYVQKREAALVIQRNARMWSHRRKFLTLRRGVIRAQANYRMIRQKRRFNQMKGEMKRRLDAERAAAEKVKARSAKSLQEEADRSARAVAGVNHLDIPAELAFIFGKIDDWTPAHSERNIVKVIGHIPQLDTKYELPHDIDYYAFTKFTNVYFKAHLWGMKREPIRTPFLAKAKDSDFQDSLSLFKLILRFMNDSNLSGKRETVLGDYIVNKALTNDKLRDELICQLCNQTWKNENEANCERGWLLMANCLSSFAPSPTLSKYLLKYVSDYAYDGYKALCQNKLLQSARAEAQLARTYPPSLLEWRANRKRANMALEALFPDGETWYGPVESWMTCEDFASVLIKQRGLKSPSGWTISLMDSRNFCEPSGVDYVLDLVSEMEIAPSFPVGKSFFLVSGQQPHQSSSVAGGRVKRNSISSDISSQYPDEFGIPAPVPPMRRAPSPLIEMPTRGPGLRKSAEGKGSRGSRDHLAPDAVLSRTSALNDRYFEDRSRSKSLDALDAPMPQTLEDLGLARSRLNERYHSVDHLGMANREAAAATSSNVSPAGQALARMAREEEAAMSERSRSAEWDPTHSTPKMPMGDRFFNAGLEDVSALDRESELDSEFGADMHEHRNASGGVRRHSEDNSALGYAKKEHGKPPTLNH